MLQRYQQKKQLTINKRLKNSNTLTHCDETSLISKKIKSKQGKQIYCFRHQINCPSKRLLE